MGAVKQNQLPFSVVMAVYEKDKPEWLRQSVESIINQTVQSDDIVIVCDGPVGAELKAVLREYEGQHDAVRVVRLSVNVGAGEARNKGVGATRHELVAIMDADDISMPNRFELQLAQFATNQELALVGGQLAEFEGDPENITGYRKVPADYAGIKKFARYRSPINHMTIMFKKEMFLSLGGYPKMTRAEDYYMVSSMLAKGYLVENIENTLVKYRKDHDNLKRRKSWHNVRENITSRYKIYKLGTASFGSFAVSSMAQVFLFLAPVGLLDAFFRFVLRSER